MLDLKQLIASERNSWGLLAEQHINPQLVRVLKLLGYDKHYVRGQGAYLYDDQDRQYLDCLTGYATFACGRNHPVVRDILRQAMELDLPNLVSMGVE
jgi:ornithine--oxo-acid transaminase